MSAMNLAALAKKVPVSNRPAMFYKHIIKEVPRIMMIYDIMDVPEAAVRKSIRNHFYKQAHIKDDRVIDMLLETGYYHLEDTLQQHKQKNHLLNLLFGTEGGDLNKKTLHKYASVDEQFSRGL